jgi:hypothetical protein
MVIGKFISFIFLISQERNIPELYLLDYIGIVVVFIGDVGYFWAIITAIISIIRGRAQADYEVFS